MGADKNGQSNEWVWFHQGGPMVFEPFKQSSDYFPAEKTAMGSFGRITSIKDLPPDKVMISLIHQAVELNEKGVSHLHGGSDNIAKRNWTIVEHAVDRVVLKIVDPEKRDTLYAHNVNPTISHAFLSVRNFPAASCTLWCSRRGR